METPVELVFDDVDSSPEVEQRIRERLRRLERRFAGITSCHVAVGRPHSRQRDGRRWNVRIEARVPGTQLVVSRKPGDLAAHEDLLVAVGSAFDAIERELTRWQGRRRAERKARRPLPQGRIHELDRAHGVGRIAMADGRLVAFNRGCVVEPSFDALSLADPVEVDVQGDDGTRGPRASAVRRLAAGAFVAAG